MSYKLIGDVFPAASTEAIDLIRSCFFFNPHRRPSAEDLLKHVFVSEFHNEEEEPIYPHGPLRYELMVMMMMMMMMMRIIMMMMMIGCR
jgi:serine/threonine protein kinase